jgi:hypothetical protein
MNFKRIKCAIRQGTQSISHCSVSLPHSFQHPSLSGTFQTFPECASLRVIKLSEFIWSFPPFPKHFVSLIKCFTYIVDSKPISWQSLGGPLKTHPGMKFVCVCVCGCVCEEICVCVCVCVVLAWSLHLEPLLQPFFVKGLFKTGSHELFVQAGFELQSSWSLPPG